MYTGIHLDVSRQNLPFEFFFHLTFDLKLACISTHNVMSQLIIIVQNKGTHNFDLFYSNIHSHVLFYHNLNFTYVKKLYLFILSKQYFKNWTSRTRKTYIAICHCKVRTVHYR